MRFVKTEDLTQGLRIARPIYNKKGVLLYDSGSKLTSQAIGSIRNFGLIGLFILDDTEPVPPMTPEDIEFERFRTVKVYELEAEFKEIITTHRAHRLEFIANDIVSSYGHLRRKVNFMQEIRSKEDYVYKHTLNVGILAAMIAFQMGIQPSEKTDIMLACLIHDIGKLTVPDMLLDGEDTEETERILKNAQETGLDMIDTVFSATPNIKRVCVQSFNLHQSIERGTEPEKMKVLVGTRILTVADAYDTLTAISTTAGREPYSPVKALKHLTSYPQVYNKKAVEALVNSINILNPGVSVELSNGEQALVISVNPVNILKPVVLDFSSNRIMDLSSDIYSDLEIVDVVKTMDSRHVVSKDELSRFGLS